MKKITIILILMTTFCFSVFAQKTQKTIKQARILVVDEWSMEDQRPYFSAVLGGVENGKFVNAEKAVKFTKTGDFTHFWLLGTGEGVSKITKTDNEMQDICPEYYSVELDYTAEEGVFISTDTPYEVLPRFPKALSNKNATYLKVVKDFLISKGIKKPVTKIDRIYSIDLEGDGTDEVVINSTNYTGEDFSDAKAGDYSFVMVRKIVNKKVQNILVAGEFYPTTKEFNAPNKYKLNSIVDLNGDGKMEIVLYGGYYEGSWAVAFELSGNKFNEVIQTGCGV